MKNSDIAMGETNFNPKAKVTFTARERVSKEKILRRSYFMSSDLPAETLGECMAEFVAAVYEMGWDPTSIKVITTFD